MYSMNCCSKQESSRNNDLEIESNAAGRESGCRFHAIAFFAMEVAGSDRGLCGPKLVDELGELIEVGSKAAAVLCGTGESR